MDLHEHEEEMEFECPHCKKKFKKKVLVVDRIFLDGKGD